MKPEFNFEGVIAGQTDFFVAVGRGKTPDFSFVRTDKTVRNALVEAATATWSAMLDQSPEPSLYDTSNEYPPTSFLYFPLADPLVEKAKYIQSIMNPSEVTNPLQVLPKISLYVAKLHDHDGRTCTAVKATSSFGRMLEQRFLARLTGQELSLVEEPKFQLSDEFDFFIDANDVFIYRHSAFESTCNLGKAIQEAAGHIVECLSQELDFVDFTSMASGVSTSLRSVRQLAAIRSHRYHQNLSRERLTHYCDLHRIRYSVEGGKILVQTEDQLLFLQLMARKILGIQLTDEGAEYFAVSSRKALRASVGAGSSST